MGLIDSLSGNAAGKTPAKKLRVAGLLLGISIGISYSYYVPPKLAVENGIIFKRENGKPSVMRMYRTGQDVLLVEDLDNKEHYQNLEDYLHNIKNKSERDIERAEILRAAKWYK